MDLKLVLFLSTFVVYTMASYLDKSFQEEPQDISVHVGDTAVFRCSIEGLPKPSVTWRQDKRVVDTDNSRFLLHEDGTLEIRRVQFSDFGRYTCEAENVARSRTSRVATLSQNSNVRTYGNVIPRFVMLPKDTTANEGSMVMFYCAANGRDRYLKKPSVSWLKDGATINISTGNSRFSVVGQGSLRIDNVQKEDSGVYTCRESNMEGSVDAKALLRVQAT